MQSVVLIIHGLVQGVFFRKYTCQKAVEFGINGTVRNCNDGSVEVYAEGGEENMKLFIEWCHHGPAGAKVERIDIHERPLKNFSGFNIIR